MGYVEPGNNYRNNPRGKNSDEESRRAQAELMWEDRVNGMSNKDIAQKYGVGERTVTNRFKEFPKEGFDRSLKTNPDGGPGNDLVRMTEAAQMWEDKQNNGLSNQQIAEKYGVSVDTVANRLGSFFPKKAAISLEAHRLRESDKLDMLEEQALRLMNTDHLVVDKGSVIVDPRTGRPMIDSEPTFKAIDRLLKIQERRAKLFGIDSPVKAEITHNTGVEIQVTELQDLVDEAKKKQYAQEQEIRKALGYGSDDDVVDAEVVEEEEA